MLGTYTRFPCRWGDVSEYLRTIHIIWFMRWGKPRTAYPEYSAQGSGKHHRVGKCLPDAECHFGSVSVKGRKLKFLKIQKV